VTERLTLTNGDWVDLSTRLNYAQRRRLIAARDEPNDVRAAEMAAAMMTGWAIRDVNDQPIPFPGAAIDGVPLASIAVFPADSLDAISIRAAELVTEAVDIPKAGAGTSGGSPSPAEASTLTSDSPTPTSSATMPDGPTPISNRPRPTSSRRSA
jgi:hypothetical protein